MVETNRKTGFGAVTREFLNYALVKFGQIFKTEQLEVNNQLSKATIYIKKPTFSTLNMG